MDYTAETVSIVLVFVVHVFGAAALAWRMLGDDGWDGLKGWWPRDDRDPDEDPSSGTDPQPSGVHGQLPMPQSENWHGRLREPRHLGDGVAPPPRRPEHIPAPLPTITPERHGVDRT